MTFFKSSIKRSILGQSIRSRSFWSRNSFQDRRSCWLFEWFHGSNIRVRFKAQNFSTIMCSRLCVVYCVVHILYIVYTINSNHFSFCLLFNEEYEINYDSRVTVLDQIRLVFIKMLSAHILIGWYEPIALERHRTDANLSKTNNRCNRNKFNNHFACDELYWSSWKCNSSLC